MKLYVKRYTEGRTTTWRGFERPVELPDMPNLKDIVNYGRSVRLQKFERTIVPENLHLDPKKEEEFVKAEWHKRLNGVWIYIKGEPVYLTGPAYVFFNYWYTEAGSLPDFRMEAVAWFQIWDMALRDPRCYGILDIKGRRCGDTEKSLFCGWELVTRYRHSWFGMQNTTEKDAAENFDRVVLSNRAMVYFFKPVLFDSDMPKAIMEMKFPAQKVHSEKKKKVKYDRKIELNSKIDYKPTKLKKYDGKRLRFYHLDEPGKITPSEMDVVKQWGIVKLCLTKTNGKYLVGKSIWTTTVEKLGDGGTVERMQKMWDSSNPNAVSSFGETSSGLWRWFRDYKYGADVDEYGYHMEDDATQIRDATIDQYLKEKDFESLTEYKRKFPATIEEALVPTEGECSFNAYLIDEQTRFLDAAIKSGEEWPTKPRTGNLEWIAGYGSGVRWIPDPNGRWEISAHPQNPNQRAIGPNGKYMPTTIEYAAGCDPVDHLKPMRDASFGAIAVGALHNPAMERHGHLFKFDEHGNILNQYMQVTNRCACVYRNRPNNPHDFYDDVIKTVTYFGCKVNVESNKPGLINYMNMKGFGAYLSNQPFMTDHKAWARRQQRNVASAGTPAATETIGSYIEAIKVHVQTSIGTYTHPMLLADMRQFTGDKDNRTKRDITVAWGWALVLMNSMSYLSEKKEAVKGLKTLPFRTFNVNAN